MVKAKIIKRGRSVHQPIEQVQPSSEMKRSVHHIKHKLWVVVGMTFFLIIAFFFASILLEKEGALAGQAISEPTESSVDVFNGVFGCADEDDHGKMLTRLNNKYLCTGEPIRLYASQSNPVPSHYLCAKKVLHPDNSKYSGGMIRCFPGSKIGKGSIKKTSKFLSNDLADMKISSEGNWATFEVLSQEALDDGKGFTNSGNKNLAPRYLCARKDGKESLEHCSSSAKNGADKIWDARFKVIGVGKQIQLQHISGKKVCLRKFKLDYSYVLCGSSKIGKEFDTYFELAGRTEPCVPVNKFSIRKVKNADAICSPVLEEGDTNYKWIECDSSNDGAVAGDEGPDIAKSGLISKDFQVVNVFSTNKLKLGKRILCDSGYGGSRETWHVCVPGANDIVPFDISPGINHFSSDSETNDAIDKANKQGFGWYYKEGWKAGKHTCTKDGWDSEDDNLEDNYVDYIPTVPLEILPLSQPSSEEVYLKHLARFQFACSTADGKVEKCNTKDRDPEDPWQTVWKVNDLSLGGVSIESVNHLTDGKSRQLCVLDDGSVATCETTSEDVDFTSMIWKTIQFDDGKAIQHSQTGKYLCSTTNEGSPYTIDLCGDVDKAYKAWSTKWDVVNVESQPIGLDVNQQSASISDSSIGGLDNSVDSVVVEETPSRTVRGR